jgi:hypothetical protein
MRFAPLRAMGLGGAQRNTLSGAVSASAGQSLSPPWTKDLILYSLNLKGLTSPKGAETGTFESLRAKLPYLQELGITGMSGGQPHDSMVARCNTTHRDPI